MSLERREFLKYVGAGAVATTLRGPLASTDQNSLGQEQKLHHDYQSNNPGTEYFLLGNGIILAALQTSPKPEYGTHCGLLLMSAEHFARKISTYLYHPERGLQNSRVSALIDGKGYYPDYTSSTVRWEYPSGVPTVVIEWEAAGCLIREELFCPINDSALIRTVTIQNKRASQVKATANVLLYPNLMFFDEYHVDRVRMTLTAAGYQTLQLFTLGEATAGDRHLSIRVGDIPAGEHRTATIVLTLNQSREEFEKKGVEVMRNETEEYWRSQTIFKTADAGLNHLFDASKSGIRAAVARSGKMDAGIWQYNFEWVRDSSMVAVGATLAGQASIAESLIRRMLTYSVDDEGRAIDASRHRPPETIELDQNGELIYALWTHWVWTGDDSLIKEYWSKIKAVANYVLKPVFMDPTIGLVKNSREYWERDAAFGVKEGYELAYQVWNIIGLELASQMATHLGEPANARTWESVSRLMKQSFLDHPRFSLVDGGRFIKRRLANGEVQRTFEPPNRKAMPPGVPLNVESISYCEPDTSSVMPIMLGLVDPKSPLAAKTLEAMELLWNQRWTMGGYGRYHLTSEPDSPGPWPFATMFLARSYLEAGNDEKVWRALRWMLGITGGKAGAWLECYVDRPVPPLPPVGVVVWTWAEIVTFFVHHVLGARPNPRNLVLRPRMLAGLDTVNAKLVVHGHEVGLHLQRAVGKHTASVDGMKMQIVDGSLTLPLPKKNIAIEMSI